MRTDFRDPPAEIFAGHLTPSKARLTGDEQGSRGSVGNITILY